MTNGKTIEQLSDELEHTNCIAERQALLKQIWQLEQLVEQLVGEE